jgi:hypothetical protein
MMQNDIILISTASRALVLNSGVEVSPLRLRSRVEDLAFTRFDILRLVATIDPTHTAPLRVADKIGMNPEKQAVLRVGIVDAIVLEDLNKIGSP